MFKRLLNRSASKKGLSPFIIRTFLSDAYYCNQVWNSRLNSPILQKVHVNNLYNEIDQKFSRSSTISAIDVDIFVNAVTDDEHVHEVLDLVHKLRLSAETSNTLASTSHATIRLLLQNHSDELLNAINDRLNYGLFLDYYTGNLLLDTFWKNKNYTLGSRTASQFMLQEDFGHPLTRSLSLLHCYSYLKNPIGWPEPPPLQEPEEEIKIRVKYLRNEYFDDHFDLVEPEKIVGKTLAMISAPLKNTLDRSFHLVGLCLHKKEDKVKSLVEKYVSGNETVYAEALKLLPEDSFIKGVELKTESVDLDKLLEDNVRRAEQISAETDIAQQCKVYDCWENERKEALKKQIDRITKAERLANIKAALKQLEEKETKLWFFENEEKLELEADSKKIYYPKRWFGKKKKPRKIDEGYIPPEVLKSRNK